MCDLLDILDVHNTNVTEDHLFFTTIKFIMSSAYLQVLFCRFPVMESLFGFL